MPPEEGKPTKGKPEKSTNKMDSKGRAKAWRESIEAAKKDKEAWEAAEQAAKSGEKKKIDAAKAAKKRWEASSAAAKKSRQDWIDSKEAVDDYTDSMAKGLAGAAKKGNMAQQKGFKSMQGGWAKLLEARKRDAKAGKDVSAYDKLIEKGKEFYSTTGMSIDESNKFRKELGEIAKELPDGLADDLIGSLDKGSGIVNQLLNKGFAKMGKLVGKATLGAALAFAANTLANMADSAKELNDNLGVGLKSSLKMEWSFRNMFEGIIGVRDETRAVQIAMTNTFRSINLGKVKKLQTTLAYVASNTGLSVDNVATLTKTFTELTGVSALQGAQLIEQTQMLANMNDVAPQQVLEDMASNSEMLAKYTDGTAEGMAKAAIQAAKLGVSLENVGGIMDSLLDLETSLTNQMEAEVLIGKDLNLDKARQLALNNDIEGAMNAVVDQLGSQAEFEQMNAIQRQALADSIGVEVGDLAKMISGDAEVKEKLPKFQSKAEWEMLALMKLNNGAIGTLLRWIGGGIAGFAAWKYLKGFFSKGGMGKMFEGGFGKIGKKIITGIAKPFKKLMSWFSKSPLGKGGMLTKVLGKIALPLTILVEIVGNLSKFFGWGSDKTGEERQKEKRAGAGGMIGAIIGGAIGSIVGPVGTGIGVAIGGFIGRALANTAIGDAIAKFFGSWLDNVKPVFEHLKATFDKIMGIFQGPGSFGTKLGKALGTLLGSIPGLIVKILGAAFNNFGALLQLAFIDLPVAIGEVLLDLGASLLITLKDFFVGFFSGFWGGIKEAVNYMLDGARDVSILGYKPFEGLPRLEDGGTMTSAGSAIVGESGPEIVTTGKGGGATVTPNSGIESINMLAAMSKKQVTLLADIASSSKRTATAMEKLKLTSGA